MLYASLLAFNAEVGIASAKVDRASRYTTLSASSASHAASLAPWKVEAWIEWALSDLLERRASQSAVQHAIYWGAANPMPWVIEARQLLNGRHHGRPLKAVVSQIATLTPHALPYQKELAYEAVYAWPQSDDDLRHIWITSTKAVLARDPKKFLLKIVSLGKESDFCAYADEALGLKEWCALANSARQACLQPGLKKSQTLWCRKNGFVTM